MTRPTWDSLREWKTPSLIGSVPAERLLTGSGLARASDPPTSHAAAAHDVGGHRARVLRAIASFRYPEPRDVIATRAGMTAYEVSKRLSELVRMGLIEVRGTQVGYSGRAQQAYIVTTAGLRVLRG